MAKAKKAIPFIYVQVTVNDMYSVVQNSPLVFVWGCNTTKNKSILYWIKENTEHTYDVNGGNIFSWVRFYSKYDAMAFKLRWS